MNKSKITYNSSGVDYSKIDPLKRLAQNLAKTTSKNSNISVIEESYGETAFVWEEEDCYRAFVIESLGTKNLIADEMRKVTGKTYYNYLAQDTLAMIINDLIAVGAKPQVVNAYFAAGSSDWFADETRAKDLTEGWTAACQLAGCVWGGGESPALSGIINSQTGELAGSAVGKIFPKNRLILGDKIKIDDSILLIASNGLHCNGASLVRKIAGDLPDGFAAKLPDGSSFGEVVLLPTIIYAKVIEAFFEEGIDIHYLVNITGHGWRKLMRANRNFTYLINQLPPVPSIFQFIQEHSGSSDADMYGTFNMGAGFAVYLPSDQVEKAQDIATKHNLKSWNAGTIKAGPKQVIIQPKGITFEGSTLDLR